MSWFELIEALGKTEDQRIRNQIIMELTYRQYIPFGGKTFEELLVENGYRLIEKTPQK